MSRKTFVLAAVAGLAVVGGVTVAARVVPWVLPPAESEASIQRRWTELETFADLPGPDVSPLLQEGPLARALATVARHPSEVDGLAGRSGSPTIPALRPNEVDPALRSALEDLSRWQQANRPLAASRCARELNSLGALRLGRLALAAARDARGRQRVEAVLRLAAELRRRGGFLHAMVGFRLAGDAARWARDRKRYWEPMFRRYRPRASEVYPAVVREAICGAEMAEGALRGDGGAQAFPSGARPKVLGGQLFVERELLMLRWYHVELLQRAFPARADLTRLAEALALPPTDELPRSYLVRAMATHYGALDQVREEIERYDELLASPPVPPKPPRPSPPKPAVGDGDPSERESPKHAAGGAGGLPPEGSGEPRVAITVEADGTVAVPQELVDYYTSDISQLPRSVRVVPALRNGGVIGFKLFGIRRGSLHRRLGLRNGDTVVAIGGVAVNSAERALEAYQRLRDAKRFELELRRRGRPVVLKYRIVGR